MPSCEPHDGEVCTPNEDDSQGDEWAGWGMAASTRYANRRGAATIGRRRGGRQRRVEMKRTRAVTVPSLSQPPPDLNVAITCIPNLGAFRDQIPDSPRYGLLPRCLIISSLYRPPRPPREPPAACSRSPHSSDTASGRVDPAARIELPIIATSLHWQIL